jgi:transposase InsO family protein
VDICFVPAQHEMEKKLPAVSGSSGRLVIETPEDKAERSWPGQIFKDNELSYVEKMHKFAADSQRLSKPGRKLERKAILDNKLDKTVKEQKQEIRREEAQLCQVRRGVREKRGAEDINWKSLKHERETISSEVWAKLYRQRELQLAARKQENERWRERRLQFRACRQDLGWIPTWIAVLMVTDNCTRQCLGLPIFVAGPKITADMIARAISVLLPPALKFLISDRGVHFTAEAFQKLSEGDRFLHVFIARHRPQSNGIAERFVRTLKEWLKEQVWQDDKALARLIVQFQDEYNNRPHQGLPIPGLSPNEFARRIAD